MDIDEIRIPENEKEPGAAILVPVYFTVDATSSSLIGSGDRWSFRMPSAQDIADAIIRRSLGELRG